MVGSVTFEELRMSGALPSPKGVALAVLEICRRDDSTLDELVRVIMTDPALSGRLIRQANVAAAAGGRAVVSVQDAVRRLGMGLVRQLALGFALIDGYSQGNCERFDYRGFWSHSLLTGLAMQSLASRLRIGPPDDLFACGLLARIGRLALATAYPGPYGEVLAGVGEGTDVELVAAEDAALHIDHNGLGCAMLADWGFPPALVEPVGFHEAPERAPFPEGSRGFLLTHALALAVRIADLGTAAESERPRRMPELLLCAGRVGLDTDALGEMIDPLFVLWREWGELLDVETGRLPAFAAIAEATPALPAQVGAGEPLRVLVVDDEASVRGLLETMLGQECGHVVRSAANGREALAVAVDFRPQVVITDWYMPEMDGIELCRSLRSSDWGRAIYVVMLTVASGEDRLVEAFAVGVDDFVAKPVSLRAIQARMRAAARYVRLHEEWERDRAQLKRFASELAVSNRKLEQAALTDALTGLPNRRAGIGVLAQAWSASRRTDQPLAVMMIDVDRFKEINDVRGHAVGDTVLVQIARALRKGARRDDWLCRMGGEEFLVVCPNTALSAAAQSAERLRRAIAGLEIEADGVRFGVTVSIGLAARETETANADSLIAAADKALYAAKHGGRNRCCLTHDGRTHLGPAAR